MDPWTNDYFQPRSEPASLFGNDVGHLAEAPVKLIAERIKAHGVATAEQIETTIRNLETRIACGLDKPRVLARLRKELADLTNQQQ